MYLTNYKYLYNKNNFREKLIDSQIFLRNKVYFVLTIKDITFHYYNLGS